MNNFILFHGHVGLMDGICFPLRHISFPFHCPLAFAGWASMRVASLQIFGQISSGSKNTTKVVMSRIEKIKLKDNFNVKSEVVSAFAYFHTILCVNFCSKLEKRDHMLKVLIQKKFFRTSLSTLL